MHNVQDNFSVTILCGTFSGNKGAASMLRSVIKNLSQELPFPVKYDVLSVYPEEDAQQNDFPNVRVVSCKPEQMVFAAFFLAILYKMFGFVPFVRKFILRNPILKSFHKADLIIDIAGVSFVDGRGFVYTMYNYICSFVPLTVNKNLVKLSQATGPYENFWNRFFAKRILSGVKVICPRGEDTLKHLQELGIRDTKLCADLAFILPDDEKSKVQADNLVQKTPEFFNVPFITVSISSVVYKNCKRNGLDYLGIMAEFVDWLIEDKVYNVLVIAQAARAGKTKLKNNDLPVCKEVYSKVRNKGKCLTLDQELPPETLRELIAKSEILVASRFHAMISALYKKVPVLLVGWSHKYQEVLDMFKLGKFATDYKKLSFEDLKSSFELVEAEKDNIRLNIEKYLPDVRKSSKQNIEIAAQMLKGE